MVCLSFNHRAMEQRDLTSFVENVIENLEDDTEEAYFYPPESFKKSVWLNPRAKSCNL